MSKNDVVNDTFFISNGRKDWKMMVESAKKKVVQAPKGAEKTPATKVIKSEKDKQTSRQNAKKDLHKTVKELDEDAGAISTTGPGTSTANVAVFAAKMGQKPQKRINEDGVEVDIVSTGEDPKVQKIEDKKAKLEQQLADLEEEKQRTIRLSELAKQKEELMKQLDDIKSQIDEVKTGKTAEHDEGSTEEEHEEHEESETEAEEAAENDEKEDEELEFNDDEEDETEEK